MLLRALPYRSPAALVSIEHFYPSLNNMEAPVSARGFRDYRDKTTSFESVAVEAQFGANLTGSGDPERVPGVRVSGDWFHVLGVAPLYGRTLRRDDDEPGHEHVVVLSHGVWTRLFAASPSAVGKSIELNGESYQIVGVMPPSFHSFFARNADLFVPLALPAAAFTSGYTNEYLNSVARLKPGVPFERAQAEMKTFADNLKKANPNNFSPTWTLKVRTLDDLSSGRDPRRAARAAGRRRLRAADRVRERREPAARASGRAHERDRDSLGARRRSSVARAAAADGERAPRARRRRARAAARAVERVVARRAQPEPAARVGDRHRSAA